MALALPNQEEKVINNFFMSISGDETSYRFKPLCLITFSCSTVNPFIVVAPVNTVSSLLPPICRTPQ
jgi:hypothetical protein